MIKAKHSIEISKLVVLEDLTMTHSSNASFSYIESEEMSDTRRKQRKIRKQENVIDEEINEDEEEEENDRGIEVELVSSEIAFFSSESGDEQLEFNSD
jgi:hypothetical protein